MTPHHKFHPLFLVMLFFFSLSLSVFGYTPYLQSGYDEHRSATSSLVAHYESTAPHVGFIGANAFFRGDGMYYAPVIGNVDSDKFPEIFFMYGDTMTGAQYDTASQNLVVEYADLNSTQADVYPMHGSYLLADADHDEDMELFYCGIAANETVIVGYDWDNDIPYEMWRIVLGDTQPANKCRMQDSNSANYNHTYLPLSYQENGDTILLFFTSNESGAQNSRGFDVDKINALTGNYTTWNYHTTSGCTNGLQSPGTHNSFAPRPWRSNDVMLNGVSPHVSPAVCGVGGLDVLYIPVECEKTSPTSGRGLLAVRLDDMSRLAGFGTQGYSEMASTTSQGQFSSPMCTASGSMVLSNDANLITIWKASVSGISSLDSPGFSINHIWLSDMFIGDMDDAGDADDVCVIGVQNTSYYQTLYCTEEVSSFSTEEVYAVRELPLTAPISPLIHITTQGTSLSAYYAGDDNQDVITPYGLFHPKRSVGLSGGIASDFEGNTGIIDYEHMYDGRLYTQQSGTCIGADIDADGYGDIYCHSPSNITIFTTGYPNLPVDILALGVDVNTLMCTGNQTYALSPLQYDDPESDRVRFTIDCENNGTITYDSGYAAYGSAFSAVCPYGAGSHTAKIGMRDEGSEMQDTVFHSTVVSDVTGCATPDGLISASIDDSGDVAGGASTTGSSTDIADDLLGVLPSLGIKKDSTREAIVIMIIILIALAFAARLYTYGSTIVPMLVVVIYLLLLAGTLFGLLRPYVLIITTLMGICGAIIYASFIGRNSAP